jgi:hypothetical protein
MARLPCPVQQRTRSTADVEHGLRGHNQWQVEGEVASSLRRMKLVVQLRENGLGELTINHHSSLADERALADKECGAATDRPPAQAPQPHEYHS